MLVVGASATGLQLAEEIHRSGREVTLSVGEHVRMPRTYRGRDIQWWMDVTGVHDERYDQVEDLNRARNLPSLQLAGSDDRHMIDLNSLSRIGVRLAGRVAGMRDGKVLFSGSLRNVCALADLKMTRLLDSIDEWSREMNLDREFEAPHRFQSTHVEESPPLAIDFAKAGIRKITPEGRASWHSLRNGLPQENAYDIVLRHALHIAGDTLCFGSTTGNVYLSEDRGETWQCLGNHFPPIYSVRFG